MHAAAFANCEKSRRTVAFRARVSDNDVMRGEETEALGLHQYLCRSDE